MNDIQKKADTFGADFQARREAAGLTPTEVGRAMVGRKGNIGVQPTFIHAVERGQYTRLKASTKRRLIEALDRAIDNKRNPKGLVPPIGLPIDVPPRRDAFDLVLLVLVSIAVGALAVLAYSVMKGA